MEGTVSRGVLRRSLHNAGVLLSGKAASGVMQLATLALAARTLGLEDFGHLSVMLAQVQLLITIATCQSNQAIVRYGVMHLKADDRPAFQALIKFGVAIDLASAAVATAAAMLVGTWLLASQGWDEEALAAWRWLALLPLTLAVAAPKGVLRLFGRFDLLARHVAVTPFARLVGAAIVAIAGGGLLGFVIAWLVAGLAGLAVGAVMAIGELRRRHLLDGWSPRGMLASNPGIWGFTLASNLHSSLNLIPPHLSTFAVGLMIGPTAAGLMKVAQELGSAFAKPIDLMNQTIYPDIARLSQAGSWRRLRKLILRSGVAAAAIGLLLALVLWVAGGWLIALVFGPAFAGADRLLMMVAIATALVVAVFAVEPTLYAIGRPSLPLLTATVSCAVFAATLFAGLPAIGLDAAGAAYVAGGAVTVALNLTWTRRLFPPLVAPAQLHSR